SDLLRDAGGVGKGALIPAFANSGVHSKLELLGPRTAARAHLVRAGVVEVAEVLSAERVKGVAREAVGAGGVGGGLRPDLGDHLCGSHACTGPRNAPVVDAQSDRPGNRGRRLARAVVRGRASSDVVRHDAGAGGGERVCLVGRRYCVIRIGGVRVVLLPGDAWVRTTATGDAVRVGHRGHRQHFGIRGGDVAGEIRAVVPGRDDVRNSGGDRLADRLVLGILIRVSAVVVVGAG